MSKKLTTKEFVKRAREKHGVRYDYSLVDYKGIGVKVKIICKDHGKFKQTPNNHLAEQGCPECANNIKLTTEQFIEQSRLIHKNKYDYSLVDYDGSKIKVRIKCNDCKTVFEQKPNDHLGGHGCSVCYGNNIPTTEEFVEKAKEIHGEKYDYSLVNYINKSTDIKIICKKHGIFEQRPDNHLGDHGCPKCPNGPISQIETKFLDFMGIPQNCRQQKIYIHDQPFRVDGYIEFFDLKIVIKLLGNYWHGNPDIFDANDINKNIKKTYGFLYHKTVDRLKLFRENGYVVFYIWENEFKNLLKWLKWLET